MTEREQQLMHERLDDDIRHLKGARRVLNCVALAVTLVAGGALAAELVVQHQGRASAAQVRCVDQGAPTIDAADRDNQPQRRRGKRRLVVVLGGVTLIGLGLLLFAGSRPPKQTQDSDSPEDEDEDEDA